MNKNIHDDDMLMVHLTIGEVKAAIKSVLQQSSSTVSNQSEIMDIQQVSNLTGYKKMTIYKLVHERKLPCYKPDHGGRRIFFKTDEVYQWLQSNRIETNEKMFQNHREDNKAKTNSKLELQQLIRLLKFSRQLFIEISAIIKNYKAKIQELEEKVSMYKKDNQMIANLFIDDIFNTTKNKRDGN